MLRRGIDPSMYKQAPPRFLVKELVVRLKGLEPPRLSSLDPKSSAATNYATAAKWTAKIQFILQPPVFPPYFFTVIL